MLPMVFRTWVFLCICTLLRLLRLAGADEFTFELPDNEKMCFYEFVKKGVECVLEYQVNIRETLSLLLEVSCKLRAYGLDDSLIQWLQDFLCNRIQCVGINGFFSQWFSVDSGIPQGSILGPILFLICINDLPNFCGEDHKIYLYADDAKFYNTITSKEDQLCLQQVINRIK